MKVLIINGPNLNLLGKREPEMYGNITFDDYLKELRCKYPETGIAYYQSNVEGELINKLHETGFAYDGIIFNAGGYTHTSVALRDAVKAISSPVVEVHISNTASREDFRNISLISGVCRGTVSGFGLKSYELALISLLPDKSPEI
ncbi:MAG: type II 3-dehydroquinate dehydratase [Culturomica sp.]|jgi:3-dehydroquinate dehydratase-2|nr:type II 3-dehydroquinate dehydratase [Culturomica sp.]